MARLAQIRFTLADFEVTELNIESIGRLADEVARHVALEVYGEGVEVDVVLEEGSLLTKIGIIGALILGTYHAVADYPDFKIGVAELVSDADTFSNMFIEQFLSKSGAKKTQVTKLTVNAATPGKINRLVNTLEDLDHQADHLKKSEISPTLEKATRTLNSVTRDLTQIEAQHLRKLLEFKHLPEPMQWPPPPTPRPSKKAYAPSEDRIAPKKTKKRRLRYHNRFTVKR